MRKILFILGWVLLSFTTFGQGVISGHVFEQDGTTPIEGAAITFSGYSLVGDTIVAQFLSDTVGGYEANLDPGQYAVSASAMGYETIFLSDSLMVTDSLFCDTIDFLLHESYFPVRYVAVKPFANGMVRVLWSMQDPVLFEDFETGDFNRVHWDNSISSFPWVIDSVHAYQGSFCMKSTCEGMANGHSEIEVSVHVPRSGQMGFQSRISSESPWDAGLFFIDDREMLECSGQSDWEEHRFDITEGEHVFRWVYRKDANTDEGDDCFYVDDIHFFIEDSVRDDRAFQYYDLFRSRFEESPVLLASHLTDTVFMDMNWNGLTWGQYCWGVCRHYEGNRGHSDTIWSTYLDKDMTTIFEADVTTNVGLTAVGARVDLLAGSNQGNEYHAVANQNGHVTIDNVYRDSYTIRVHLDGYVDYVSDSLVSVMEPTQVDVELREEVKGVDSLYVSSTGWAIWQLSDTLYRNLQYIDLQLDSIQVGRTLESFYQIEVDGLTPGQTYQARVRPVYLSDTCEWRSYNWTYRSCADFQQTTSGLQGVVYDNGVLLSWHLPENDSLLGTMLFRENDVLAFVEGTSYLDESVDMQGVANYGIRLVYDGDMEGSYYAMACEENVTVPFPAFCDPPVKLEAENFLDGEEYGALISWGERPEPVEGWLHYDNGEYRNSIGGGDEPVIFWSVRFDAEYLAEYQGTELKKVSLFDIGAGTYQLWIYKGGETAPATLVRSQNMLLTGMNGWHEELIVPALEITGNEPIWIVVGQQGLSRPAAVCSDMGDPDGRWVSLDGTAWTDLHTYNMHYTWMLRAFVSNRFGKLHPLGNDNYILQHYNLYRSYENVNYQQIAAIPAVEGQVFYQYLDLLVGDTHHDFYYRLTAVYLSDDGEICESDDAASMYAPENHYVWVDDHWFVDENQNEVMAVYPNPATEMLYVESKDMRHLRIFNVMGQCLGDEAVNSDNVQLNLSDLASGLYLLQVTTKNGVQSCRFVVSH